jgi:hypothetical protein
MKLLYENTKTCSSDLGNKIDDLKKIFSNQQTSIGMNSMYGGGIMNPYQSNMMEGMIDPSLMKKGIEDIRE